MNIDIVEREPIPVAYLRYVGPNGEPLGRFWRQTVVPWIVSHDLADCPRFGVSVDEPPSTPPEQCRYDACVAPPPGLMVPGAAQTTIPGGRYAITCFKGTGPQIGAAWTAFINSAIARGLARDPGRPLCEHFPRGATYDPRTGVFGCELWLPV